MTRKLRWQDLSTGRKLALIVVSSLQIGLLFAALWDIAHRSSEEVRGDRRIWVGLVFINWFGPLAYFTIGRKGGVSSLVNWFSSLPACCQERA